MLSQQQRTWAAQAIPPQTVVEISPMPLLFGKQEHDAHGKHTLRDHYTFDWKDGQMVLALGLGSLFNHAENPNISFSVDTAGKRIVYTSTRAIQPNEELCICYSHQLRFDPVDSSSRKVSDPVEPGPSGGLANIQESVGDRLSNTLVDQHNDMDDIVEEAELPFTWKKLVLEKEEERLQDIELVQAWVVDIPDQTHIATMLRWLKQAGSRQGRSIASQTHPETRPFHTLLLDTSSAPPSLPPSPPLDPPYQLPVPCHPARTPTSLSLKNTFWPTVFAPKRKWELEPWTRAKVRWASEAIHHLKHAHAEAVRSASAELPVVAHVPVPYCTRRTAHAPLFRVADDRTQRSEDPPAGNGAQYLLTGLTLFVTHEPCLMCAMALLHSRVKEVFYLIPMPYTGGCGSLACVPALKGVNHRFSVAIWKEEPDDDWPRSLDTAIDI
ncbi:hypothetical protein JVU11DRAFT_3579 [Chiua virens]|nr:hypothetical protein JVU11DRAFT_3579 [Chiua virens]